MQRWWPPVAVAAAAAALSTLDATVNIAFPAITAAFDLDVARIQWVVISYVLTYASLLMAAGRLADAFGHRRVLLVGLAISTAAFVGTGLAGSFPLFLAARVLQGVGAGLLLGPAPALVTLSAPEGARARALGIYQMGSALGFAAGPALGGVLVELWDWRSVFLFRVPVALGLAVAALAIRPVSRPSPSPGAARPHLDLPGALTLGGGVAAGLLAASRARELGWGSPLVVGGLLVSAALLVGWNFVESRARQPLLDPGLLRVPSFAQANALNVVANGTMFAIWLLGPYYLVTVRGHSPIAGGAVLGASALGAALAAPVAGRLADRVRPQRLATAGLAIEAAGLAAIAALGPVSPTVAVVGAFALVGAGLGLFQVPNQAFVMGSIAREHQGVAGGLTQMMRTVGITMGVTAASLLFATRREAHAGRLGTPVDTDITFSPAFRDVFVAAAVVCAAGVVMSMFRATELPQAAPAR